MGINAKIMTAFGEKRDCYIRLNSVEASNHRAASQALFRAFLSKAAFEGGAQFVAEFAVEFYPDVSLPVWPQAYEALVEQNSIRGIEA
jgi:hypothetical protein